MSELRTFVVIPCSEVPPGSPRKLGTLRAGNTVIQATDLRRAILKATQAKREKLRRPA